ncbi:MAG: 16S rRNA (guanine(527)-N(7))-methyltransferase RsmG [Ectothiorhodospiraceae bacterium]|nr:16S rRNA (guanine(527)-N(7))-methyltransferase RsmG [Ectothiorhodospiraceae bacterium]
MAEHDDARRRAADVEALDALLEAGAESMGIALDALARDRLVAYVRLLERWNAAYNLTAVRDPVEMVSRHLLDSLTVLDQVRGPRVLDVGSGAGLPGIVLAVARPALAVTLLDSVGKKVRFLEQARLELRLDNVTPVQARVEAYRPPAPFQTVVSRAALALGPLWRAARGLLVPGGRLVAMKARLDAAETAELDDVAWTSIEVVVPGLEERRLVVVERHDDARGPT